MSDEYFKALAYLEGPGKESSIIATHVKVEILPDGYTLEGYGRFTDVHDLLRDPKPIRWLITCRTNDGVKRTETGAFSLLPLSNIVRSESNAVMANFKIKLTPYSFS